ncbi:MAG TPA: pitrilysin family protein [Patescibacteria group bacterium]|nr:pitrilysin family protein [Patescibacteria group bacterium]
MTHSRTVLPNGLRLITVPMPSFESATVLVMVGAGSRYETKKNSGISHFLEHMAFKGTKKRPSAMHISSLIDGIGGEFNAFTGKETTGYYIKAAKNNIEICMDVISDMIQNMLLDEKEIEKEKGVILEEINLYEDMPMRKIGDVYERLLYGDSPMGWDIAGEKDIIRSIKKADFVKYMKSLYSADNMTIVVAGGLPAGRQGIDEKDIQDRILTYFGSMEKFGVMKAPTVKEAQKKPAVLIKHKVTEQIHIAIGVRTVPIDSQEKYPLSVLSSILGGGMSSRLFHEVREKRGLAYYVRSNSDHYKDAGSLVTTAGVDPKRVLEAVEVIVSEFAKAHTDTLKITGEELKKAKEYLKGHMVLELEDSRAVSSYYAHQELIEDTLHDPSDTLKAIDAVTVDGVRKVAKKYFVNEGLNLALIGNFKDGQKLEKLLKL